MDNKDDLQKANKALEILKSIKDEGVDLWTVIHYLEGYIENRKMLG